MQSKFISVYLLTFVNILGFSILMPVLPFIVEEYHAPKYVYGLLLSSYSFFQFIGAPYWGRMSDSYGRKSILIISQVGTLLSWIVFGLAYFTPSTFAGISAFPLLIIAISRILDGITGGNNAVAEAYIADITTPAEKRYIFSYIGGIAGLGMIVGPGLGGYASSFSIGYLGTVIVATIISTITTLTLFFGFQESLPVEKRRPFKSIPFMDNFNLWKKIVELQSPQVINTTFLIKALFQTGMAFYISTIPLFIIDLFKFTQTELGMFMLFVGGFMSFNQIFLSKRIIEKFGEHKGLQLGLLLSFVGYFSITLTDIFWLYLCLYYIMNLGISLCIPSFNTIFAKNSAPEKMGEVMGISNSIASLAVAIFPVLGAYIYGIIGYKLYWFISVLPLACLWIAYNSEKQTQNTHATNT